ncbi:hypothetical protein [Allobranchiibius sp. GilTou73]|uniref:hypothetical protein n=1 Tax=Allobranchiibius sp. GilTou73 TaxID=2904523 RepID=UPI001F2AF7FA|nr:hypothetical protein [Allobranchiibius sp. GilTou73]UIJ35958.1 hypothetical protein LVQ62_06160 [Allobranchiibius sp. GilTou73]
MSARLPQLVIVDAPFGRGMVEIAVGRRETTILLGSHPDGGAWRCPCHVYTAPDTAVARTAL